MFSKNVYRKHKTITDTSSITPFVSNCIYRFGYWLPINTSLLLFFTAVLIVACPCVLALTAPFTMGNVANFGKQQFYLKNALVIELLP
jgi:Cu+-exporting ATPase